MKITPNVVSLAQSVLMEREAHKVTVMYMKRNMIVVTM